MYNKKKKSFVQALLLIVKPAAERLPITCKQKKLEIATWLELTDILHNYNSKFM